MAITDKSQIIDKTTILNACKQLEEAAVLIDSATKSVDAAKSDCSLKNCNLGDGGSGMEGALEIVKTDSQSLAQRIRTVANNIRNEASLTYDNQMNEYNRYQEEKKKEEEEKKKGDK